MARLVALWTSLLWLASATGIDPSGLLSIPSIPGQSIDLLGALGLYNESWVGVTLTKGPPPMLRPAYLLQGDHRDLRLPPLAFQQVADLLQNSPEFTISARLRQEPGNTGTVVSFAHSAGGPQASRYLELQSSGRRNEIRLHYVSRLDAKNHVETFPYVLADDKWHDLAVSVSGSQVELLVDCKPQRPKRLLKPGVPERNFSRSAHLFLGQRNNGPSYYFKGAMEEVRLIGGPHGYLFSCPHLDSTCPTCGQFVQLQNTVEELTRHLQELSERLIATEKRIAKVEECDCQKSCFFNGTVHADGAKWQSGCQLCSCVHGDVECNHVECPEVDCKHPIIKTGECCQVCLKRCLFLGTFYDHGDVLTTKRCSECTCHDGSMICPAETSEMDCPKLTCPPEQQFSVPDHCCKFCPDIDECQQEGGLEGHHCHLNTRCVNTPGSYVCECLPGYRRIDSFNCAELDECSTGEHNCDLNAECINTQGSYHCVCKEGYSGDGYNCEPVCHQGCLNGGVCRLPGKCFCPNGYTGSNCERDLDECETNSHRCTNTSVCVNMIGWYYCQCKQGYENPHQDNTIGNTCLDIDECNTDIHTCHPSAQCNNTNGGYECICPPGRSRCKLSCMFEGREVPDGMTKSPEGDSCRTCTCRRGVMTCEEPKCNCSLPGSDENHCCPKCNKKHACIHQELREVLFNHGERWSYQCQTCECLYGEMDCWDMRCPPLLCENPVKNPEDCCPHCEDLCSMGNASALGQPCTFLGRLYESGSRILDPNDNCTACNCKDGMLCCSYNYDCDHNSRPVGFNGVVAAPSPRAGPLGADGPLDPNKQYPSAVRVPGGGRLGPDKTERKAGPGG